MKNPQPSFDLADKTQRKPERNFSYARQNIVLCHNGVAQHTVKARSEQGFSSVSETNALKPTHYGKSVPKAQNYIHLLTILDIIKPNHNIDHKIN